MKTDRIRDNLDACLRDVRVSAALHNEIMCRAVVPSPGRRIHRPRKIIVAVAVIAVLLLTTAVEAVTHKKIDPKYEGWLHGAGMILLLGLMAIIMFKDIFVLFRG